jgi:Fe-S-cluster containining protein
MDCTCEECVMACKIRVGWFAPGEVARVAEFLKVSEEELFRTKLAIDYWCDEEDIYLLTPASIDMEPGTIVPYDHAFENHQCIFLKNERCEIHNVKPFECRESSCQGNNENLHEQVAKLWDTIEGKQEIRRNNERD